MAAASQAATRRQQPQPVWKRLYTDLASPAYDLPYLALLVLFETALCSVIILKIAYTEIDWVAYMQEVEGWLVDGEYDYFNLKGNTGPLVYPAGFLYLYAGLRHVAGGDGSAVRKAQWAFAVLYVLNSAVVGGIYTLVIRERRRSDLTAAAAAAGKSTEGAASASASTAASAANAVWSLRLALGCLALSKRIHSIFVLRLFNDAPAMLLFYISCYLFATHKWRAGCLFFSLAVSIKMNVLLFAPGLLLLLLQSSPDLVETAVCLGICAAIQLIVGAPFLFRYPVSYIRKAFEFDRVFFYEWTVNLKFLPEETFVSKKVSLLLLGLHLSCLVLLAVKWLAAARSQTGGQRRIFLLNDSVGSAAAAKGTQRRQQQRRQQLSAEYVAYTLFVSNFIGVACARTLHYQFYCWYFHALPLLLWSPAVVSLPLRVLVLGAVEYAFNVFPATSYSSAVLQAAHAIVLGCVVMGKVPAMFVVVDEEEGRTTNSEKKKD